MARKDILSLYVATLALGVSCVALYFAQFEGGKIHAVASDRVQILHYKGGQLGVVTPVSLTNSGAQQKTVTYLLLQLDSEKFDSYLLEPKNSVSFVNNKGELALFREEGNPAVANERYEELYALLLVAAAGRTPVLVRTTGCNGQDQTKFDSVLIDYDGL